jgi:uridine phosphorylase
MLGEVEVAVGFTGIGRDSTRIQMTGFLAAGPWKGVVAGGFAGGLDPALRLGDTVVECLPATSPRTIATREFPVETATEKDALFRESGSAVVDMETAVIAEACATAGTPLVVVRTVSDPAETDLPVPFRVWFDLELQRPRVMPLLGYLLLHPRKTPAFARFVAGLGKARRNLAAAVENEVRRLAGQLQ